MPAPHPCQTQTGGSARGSDAEEEPRLVGATGKGLTPRASVDRNNFPGIPGFAETFCYTIRLCSWTMQNVATTKHKQSEEGPENRQESR